MKSMKQQRKAVIDIDNTLWHFCDVLFERLQKINETIPPPDGWVEWDFWENYCSKEEFLGAIKNCPLFRQPPFLHTFQFREESEKCLHKKVPRN